MYSSNPDIKSLSAVLFIIVFFHVNSVYADTNKDFNIQEVAKGIYVHRGKHVAFEDPDHDDIANIGFIIGEKCIAVVDTGGSVRIGRKLKSAIRDITHLPICYVINTHIHYDHVLGNLVFVDKNTKFVGHHELPAEIEENRHFFLEQFGPDLGPGATEDSIIGPDITVNDNMKLELGNRTLILTAYGPAHSYSDLSVYDPETGTLWLADLLFMERIPALDGDLKGWIAVLDRLKTMPAKRVIPGHGPASAGWPEAADAEMHYLKTLLKQTRSLIAQGQSMEEVIENVGKEEKTHWLLYEQHHKRNVSKAFTQLEWE